MACCNNGIFVGVVDVTKNENIVIPFTPTVNGKTYTLKFEFGSTFFEVATLSTTGQRLAFPSANLNESANYVATLYDGSTQQTVTIDGSTFDCFIFQTALKTYL